MTRLTDWWADNAKAPWGLTAGQLAVGILRTHCGKDRPCSHSVPEAKRLEREASYGGRATAFYVGPIPSVHDDDGRDGGLYAPDPGQDRLGGLTQVDFRAMYPTLLRDREFPRKLITVRADVRPAELVGLCEHFGVIARVTAVTERPYFPLREYDRVFYPVGQFQTTLTGYDLVRLSQHGEIYRCHLMALYQKSRCFATAADALLRLRFRADSARDACGSAFAKLIANSLGGKLAQRPGAWARDAERDDWMKWGEHREVNFQTGAQEVRRFILGQCFKYHDDKETAGPYAAAFAYLAAYGRGLMDELREACPERTVVSQDTDGLWLLGSGAAAVRDVPGLFGAGPGQLRVVTTAREGRFFGPRHYTVDGKWVLSGFHLPELRDRGRKVWHQVKQTLWSDPPREAPTETHDRWTLSNFPLEIGGGSVGEDGWVVPLRLPRRDIHASPLSRD